MDKESVADSTREGRRRQRRSYFTRGETVRTLWDILVTSLRLTVCSVYMLDILSYR